MTQSRHYVVIGAGVLGASVAARLAWADLAPDLDGAAWYRLVGNIELATSPVARAELTARVSRLASWNYDARLIDLAEAVKLEPSLRLGEPGTVAAWFPGEGYLLTEPGRWVSELAALTGAATMIPLIPWDIPGATAPGLVVQVGPVSPAGTTRLVHTPEICLRPHPGGLLHLEAPDAAVDLHTPDPDLRRWAAELLRRAQHTVQGLDQARIVEYQVCVRPMPVDGQSIVGPLPDTHGLYVAVTHSGVTLAAHLSQLIAAELTAGTQPAELAPYRPSRFLSAATPDQPG